MPHKGRITYREFQESAERFQRMKDADRKYLNDAHKKEQNPPTEEGEPSPKELSKWMVERRSIHYWGYNRISQYLQDLYGWSKATTDERMREAEDHE